MKDKFKEFYKKLWNYVENFFVVIFAFIMALLFVAFKMIFIVGFVTLLGLLALLTFPIIGYTIFGVLILYLVMVAILYIFRGPHTRY